MKALFYSHTGKVSGAERIQLLLLERLDRGRIDPVAVCPKEGGLFSEIRRLGVPTLGIREVSAKFSLRPDRVARSIASLMGAVAQLRRKISEESPDLIHANSVRAGVVATLASVGSELPVVWHIQDELGTHPFSTAIRLLVRFSARTSLIAVSNATLESFRGLLLDWKSIQGRSAVIMNGVDSARFDVAEEEGEAIRASLGISREHIVFGCIGQITPRKNQKGLVESFASIAKEVPFARLLIAGAPIFAGDDAYLREIADLVRAHGLEDRIHFLGHRSDVAEVISSTDAVIVNSHSEALVLVAIEAMMCGRPVIATKVGGTGELIEHLVSGWLIPAGDDASLKEALRRLAGSPALRISLAKEGRRVARSRFTAETLLADFERFVLGRKIETEGRPQFAKVGEAVAEGK